MKVKLEGSMKVKSHHKARNRMMMLDQKETKTNISNRFEPCLFWKMTSALLKLSV